MPRAGWYILAGLGVLILVAALVLWITSVWIDDPDTQGKLGYTGAILFFPGFLLTGFGLIGASDG